MSIGADRFWANLVDAALRAPSRQMVGAGLSSVRSRAGRAAVAFGTIRLLAIESAPSAIPSFRPSHPNFRLMYLILCLRPVGAWARQRRLPSRLVLLWPCLSFPIRRHSLRLRLCRASVCASTFAPAPLPSRCRDVCAVSPSDFSAVALYLLAV